MGSVTYTIQMVSATHCSLKAAPLKMAPIVDVYSRSGEGIGRLRLPGLVEESTRSHFLLMIPSKMSLFPLYLRRKGVQIHLQPSDLSSGQECGHLHQSGKLLFSGERTRKEGSGLLVWDGSQVLEAGSQRALLPSSF